MRRIFAVFAAAAVLVPIAVTAAPYSALAATNKLTVTTISRTGAKVKTEVSVENLSTHAEFRLTSGKPRKLPKGWYAVLADVYTAKDDSNTLGARVVKVSGNTKTTIDARRGKPVKVSLSPAVANASQQLTGGICLKDDNSSAFVEASNQPGKLFLVPHTSKKLQFAYLSQWSAYSPTGQSSEYVDAGNRTGVPKSFTRTVKRSRLARVSTQVRRGPAGSPESYVNAEPLFGGCPDNMSAMLGSGEAPFTVDAYLTPGKWLQQAGTWYNSDHIGSYYAYRTVAPGKSYTQAFFRSAWGPGVNLPYVSYRSLQFDTSGMFTDPGFSDWYSSEAASKSVVTLTRRGKTLKKQNRTTWGSYEAAQFSYRLKAAGWYTLKVDSKRYRPGTKYPADMLSTRSTATFHVYASPRKSVVAPVYLTRFTPTGLNLYNQAMPGGETTIQLRLERRHDDPEVKLGKVKVKNVVAKASFDGGKTWVSVRVTHQGGKWATLVKNPASGYVALRAKVTDTKGNNSEMTVYRAYAIK